jgi:hypothetical protein
VQAVERVAGSGGCGGEEKAGVEWEIAIYPFHFTAILLIVAVAVAVAIAVSVDIAVAVAVAFVVISPPFSLPCLLITGFSFPFPIPNNIPGDACDTGHAVYSTISTTHCAIVNPGVGVW